MLDDRTAAAIHPAATPGTLPDLAPDPDRLVYAYCWSSGRVDIGAEIPSGALAFIAPRGPEAKVRRLVEVTCRHAYDNETFLVPGVPEAADDRAAVDALIRFRDGMIKPRRAEEGW